MSETYKKFQIGGDTRGKENLLRVSLIRQFKKSVTTTSEPRTIASLQVELQELRQQIVHLNIHQSISTTTPPLEDSVEWLQKLSQRLHQEGISSVQEILSEFGVSLPKAIRNFAAKSRRTELEITLDILDKVAFVLRSSTNESENFRGR